MFHSIQGKLVNSKGQEAWPYASDCY